MASSLLPKQPEPTSWTSRILLVGVLYPLLSVSAAQAVRLLFVQNIDNEVPFLFQTLAVAWSTWYGGFLSGLTATALATGVGIYLVRTGVYSHTTTISIVGFVIQAALIKLIIHSLRRSLVKSRTNEERFKAQGDQLRALLDGAKDYAIFMLDPKGYILSWNRTAQEIYGYDEREALGRKFSTLYPSDEQLSKKPEKELAIAARDGRMETEGAVNRRNGSTFWADRILTSLYDPKGHLRGFAQVTRDISERKAAEDMIQHQALHDPLTNLPTRLLLQERLEPMLSWAGRNKNQVTVLCVNIERFKNINDTLGHSAGDNFLKGVAQRITDFLRPGDLAGRLGGDQFILVLEGAFDYKYINKLKEGIAIPYVWEDKPVHLQINVGCACFPSDATDATTLLKFADTALASGTRDGAITRYTPKMAGTASARFSLEEALRVAVEKKELQIAYQPIFNIKDRSIQSCEALLRWNHPKLGPISPMEFIPIAEESGLIISIGEWVLEHVIAQQASWLREGLKPVPVAINISGKQFSQDRLVNQIDSALRRNRLPANLLSIEVTESVAMQDLQTTINRLRDICNLGVNTAIDDFGTGFSSLSYLKQLPLMKAKIDKSFVTHCATDSKDAAIIKAVVMMAHSLDLQVVAEGIETEEQLTFLRGLKCDLGQGYLVSKPLFTSAFQEVLQPTLSVVKK